MTRVYFRAALLALLIQAGAIVSAPAQGGRPIQFSEPRSDKVSTNLNRLGQGLSRLDRLESELAKPFDFISPGNSMQGGFIAAPLPTPPPVVNNPRVKELIDRKRDLPYMTPEEVFEIEPPEEKFRPPELTPDGRDRNKLSPSERYFLDRMNTPESGRDFTAQGGELNAQTDRFSNRDAQSPLLRGVSDLERNLRNLSGGGSLFEDRNKPSLRESSDFFGMGENPAARPMKRTDSEMQRIEQFKELYDFGPRPEGVTARDAAQFSNPYLDRSFYDPPQRVTVPNAASSAGSSLTPGASVFSSAPVIHTPPPLPPPAPAHTPSPSPFISVPKRTF